MTTTPNTPQELLDMQEKEETNPQKEACLALLDCTPQQSWEVAQVILESLRDWHVAEAKKPNSSPQWLVDATRLDLALKTLNLVSWD